MQNRAEIHIHIRVYARVVNERIVRLNLQFSVARIFAALAGSKTHSPFDILNIKLNTNKLIV